MAWMTYEQASVASTGSALLLAGTLVALALVAPALVAPASGSRTWTMPLDSCQNGSAPFAHRIKLVSDPTKEKPDETSSRQALRGETRGILVIALAIFIFYVIRYFHLTHGSAH